MYSFCVLNSIIPKLKPSTENLDAHSRNWYTDGYRTSTPSTNTCHQDSDCEGNEICQSGYCAGLHRTYSTYGLYYGNEYKRFIGEDSSTLNYLYHGVHYRPNDFFYDYMSGKSGIINRPSSHIHTSDTYKNKLNYDYSYR